MPASLISCTNCDRFFAAGSTAGAAAAPLCPVCHHRASRAGAPVGSIRPQDDRAACLLTRRRACPAPPYGRRRAHLLRSVDALANSLRASHLLTEQQVIQLAMIGALHAVGVADRQVVLLNGPPRSGTSRVARTLLSGIVGLGKEPQAATLEIHAPTMADRLLSTPTSLAGLLMSRGGASPPAVLVDEVALPAPWSVVPGDDRHSGVLLLRQLLLAPVLQETDGTPVEPPRALVVVTASFAIGDVDQPASAAAALVRVGVPPDLAGVLAGQVVTLGAADRSALARQILEHPTVVALQQNVEDEFDLHLVVPDTTAAVLARQVQRSGGAWTVETAVTLLQRVMHEAAATSLHEGNGCVVIGPDEVLSRLR